MYHVSHEIFTSGFSLETGPSTVPGAGNGVFVAEGEVIPEQWRVSPY